MTDYLERTRIARVAKLELLSKWFDEVMEGNHAPTRQLRDAESVPEPS